MTEEGLNKMIESANPVDQWYKDLLVDILAKGTLKGDRTGTGTTSVFGRVFRHKMSDGFPLLTSKKMYTKGIIIELLWFLGRHMKVARYNELGRTNIRFLLDNDCFIWVGDSYKYYLTMNANMDNELWFAKEVEGESRRLYTKTEFVTMVMDNDVFAKQWGNLGPVYGKQWCSWGADQFTEIENDKLVQKITDIDELFDAVENDEPLTERVVGKPRRVNLGGLNQINKLIHDLEVNPDSRRLMVTAWNPDEVDRMVLPPCHYGFQCYTRLLTFDERRALTVEVVIKTDDPEEQEKLHKYMDIHEVPRRELSLSWNQRSVDTPLGLPFNIASYGFLLHMIATVVNMKPGDLIGYLGDTHIYNNQHDGIIEQMSNPTFPLPKLTINKAPFFQRIDTFDLSDFKIEGYESAGPVRYPLSN